MFESNMLENIESMKQCQNNSVWRNDWRELVTPQFTAFLDSLSANKQETTEEETE